MIKANLVNDRGIHICKSMLAYQRWGHETTPEKSGKKGDHLVGDFYVLFDQKFTAEYRAWLPSEEASDAFEKWLQVRDGISATRA